MRGDEWMDEHFKSKFGVYSGVSGDFEVGQEVTVQIYRVYVSPHPCLPSMHARLCLFFIRRTFWLQLIGPQNPKNDNKKNDTLPSIDTASHAWALLQSLPVITTVAIEMIRPKIIISRSGGQI